MPLKLPISALIGGTITKSALKTAYFGTYWWYYYKKS